MEWRTVALNLGKPLLRAVQGTAKKVTGCLREPQAPRIMHNYKAPERQPCLFFYLENQSEKEKKWAWLAWRLFCWAN
jgi:hypothetical protein